MFFFRLAWRRSRAGLIWRQLLPSPPAFFAHFVDRSVPQNTLKPGFQVVASELRLPLECLFKRCLDHIRRIDARIPMQQRTCSLAESFPKMTLVQCTLD